MDRISVSSTNLSSVGYDPSTETLEIRFKTGGTYQYYNVPESKYKALMSASSKGSYFASQIKNSYRCNKI